jgi:hypothetical protein
MTRSGLVALLILLSLSGTLAHAQELKRGQTVANRPRPDFDPLGIPVRSFRLFPEMAVDVAYDSNVFAQRGTSKSDYGYILAPSLILQSDWTRHNLETGASFQSAFYDEYSDQDFTDYDLWLAGGLEVGTASRFGARVSHAQEHELRTTPNFQGLEPTEFTSDQATFDYRFAPNRLFVKTTVAFEKQDWDSTLNFPPPDGPGGTTSNDDRDRLNSILRVRTGFKTSPDLSLFVEGRYFDFDYDTSVDRNGNNRDNDGYDFVAGAEIDLSGVTFGEVFAGYRSIDYADNVFETQDGFTYGATLDWNLTGLTTISFGAAQRLLGTTVDDASGIESTELEIGVDHELLRNLILSLAYQYDDQDFLNIDRTDDFKRVVFSGQYFLSRRWLVNGGYIYQDRESDEPTADQFSVSQVYLGFKARI